ncbi:hypothetical protein Ahy_A04g017162 [Arachis hypogaea]|uniref:DC1 domain-containing protein n=1 Tax=Arachis hypogaea TaxID=3818 RepID=A0A445DA78_ARAHY|nr:hypothetical protein Ahy_A04g017162 [Arachis hypogaea]
MEERVCDYVSNRRWDLNRIAVVLGDDWIPVFRSTKTPEPEMGEDILAWLLTSDGAFSIKSACSLYLSPSDNSKAELFSKIWKLEAPQRLRTFCWLVANEVLLTNEIRVKRNMTQDGSCVSCGEAIESMLHVIRDCRVARQTWMSIDARLRFGNFFNTPLLPWLLENLSSQSLFKGVHWPLLFVCIMNALWLRRNKVIFDSDEAVAENSIHFLAFRLAKDYSIAHLELAQSRKKMASANYYYYYNYIHSLETHQDPHESSPDRNVVLQGSKNYQEWRQAMNLKLEKTKTLWFVHGTDAAVMNEPRIYGEWKTRKELVLSWIHGSISEEIKKFADALPKELGVWKALMKLYSSHESIITDIKKEIDSLKQETRTLMEYKINGGNRAVHNTEDTGIEKQQIVLSEIHKHALTSTPPGAPYSCDGCKERGCGRSYRCEEKNCSGYVLHEECANAVLQRQKEVSHPFFEGQEFRFLEKPLGYPRVCDACRMEVQGFVYHREATKKDTGLDLHPCCLKLRDNISYEESNATKTLTLKQNVKKKCVRCKRKEVGDDSEAKGWSYVTSDGDCYHVSCFKEWFLEKFRDDYFSEKKVVVSKMQSNVVESNNMKVVEVGEGSNSSKGSSSLAKKMVVTIAPVVVKLIFSAIFGDPVSFVLALVEALVTSFN